MNEKKLMDMYADMFENFENQVRVFLCIILKRQNREEPELLTIFDGFKSNLKKMLDILSKSIDNYSDEEFKRFYKNKCQNYMQYIDNLNATYNSEVNDSKTKI